jgi:hypothetical protein
MALSTRFRLLVWAMVITGGLVPATAFAHHSFSMFDTSKPGTITGTVKDFEWSNPHCWLDIVVGGSGGQDGKWSFEGQSVSMLARKGWSKTTIKPGDKITVAYYPNKNGSKSGAVRAVTLANGTVLSSYAAAPE